MRPLNKFSPLEFTKNRTWKDMAVNWKISQSQVVLALAVLLGVFLIWWFLIGHAGFPNETDISIDMNLLKSVKESLDDIKVNIEHTDVTVGNQNYEVYYLEAKPKEEAKADILLLHGKDGSKEGSSDLWESADSLRVFAAAGYHVIAPDLPGTKQSRTKTENEADLKEEQRQEFLKKLMEKTKIENVIIFGASWGGAFTIPLLIAQPDLVKAFVAVVPDWSKLFTEDDYKKVEVPTLIIYGEIDRELGDDSYKAFASQKKKPTIKRVVVPKVGRDLIQEKGDEFHAASLNYLKTEL